MRSKRILFVLVLLMAVWVLHANATLDEAAVPSPAVAG